MSSEISIDIATRYLGPDEDIYVLRAGDGYHLLDVFKRSRHVFLDFPALPLDFSEEVPADYNLRLAITMSLTLSDWLLNDKTGPRPSLNPRDYVGKDFRRRLGRYVAAVKRLYFELKPGTILVIPPSNPYEDVLIGEITGKPKSYSVQKLYDGHAVPARKVNWLRSKPKAQFSPEFRATLERPDPLMLIDRDLRGEVLRTGFDQYSYEGEFAARISTEEDEFNTLDDFNIQSFVNYVTGAIIAAEAGIDVELGFEDALQLLRNDPTLALDLKQNINSKGFQKLVDTTVRPLAVAALLSLALQGGHGSAKPKSIVITNSAVKGDDPCKLEVDQRVAGALKIMKIDEWVRVCEKARDAQKSTGLSTSMDVESRARRRP